MDAVVTVAGATVDGYLLSKQIGEGPFGVVFQGKDVRRGTQAAIKLLKQHIASQALGRTTFGRLQASIKAYAELDHPNLARVIRTVQEQEQSAYGLALELIEGQPLARMQLTLLATPASRTIDPHRLARLLSLFEQVTRVLAWLHARGVVHGNLKPSNIMLIPGTPEATVKVLDLCWSAIGVARPAAGAESYLSPEQLEGVPPTALSDQWTSALMLQRTIQATTNHLPQTAANGLPPALIQALDRALKPAPAQRYPQVADFAQALNSVRLALIDEPTDKQAKVHNSAGPAPSKNEFAEEPATVKVPITSAIPRAPVPAVESRPTERHAVVTRDDQPSNETTPVEAPTPVRPHVGRAPMEMLERDTLEPGDLFKDVKSEPSLHLDALTLPPEAHLPPTSPGAGAKRSKISPLALWGAILFATAAVVVLGTLHWLRGKSAVASTPIPVEAPKPAPDPGAASAKVEVAAEAPKVEQKPEVAKADSKPAVTRMPDVAVRPDEPAEETKRRKRPEKSTASKALDAKADAAMERLASLGGGAEEAPASSGDKRKHEVSCDEGDGAACFELGKLWKSERRDDKAREAFAQSCRFKNAEGCHRAAELWRSADPAKAKELQMNACKYGRSASCRAETKTSTSS